LKKEPAFCMMIEVRTFACGEKELRIERTNLQSGKGKTYGYHQKDQRRTQGRKVAGRSGSQAD